VTGGCRGTATSFDADGRQLDRVNAPGEGGTSDDPFQVDPEGHVVWQAGANPPISGTWTVETKSTPKLSFGGDGGLDQDGGSEELKDHLVVDLPIVGDVRVASGKFYVEVVIEGGGESCTFAGYVEITGSPLETPLFWGGVVLAGLGLGVAFTATPTAAAAAGATGTTAAPGLDDAPPAPADDAPPPPADDAPPPPADDAPPPPADDAPPPPADDEPPPPPPAAI
jgi:hypothetical protein